MKGLEPVAVGEPDDDMPPSAAEAKSRNAVNNKKTPNCCLVYIRTDEEMLTSVLIGGNALK